MAYRGPQLIAMAADACCATGLNALDAGCGTGLVAHEIARHCSNITGVDLSDKMLVQARGLYQTLERGEVTAYMTTAVVFAYHNVGVRCLKALIGRGVKVALVVTHQDNPNETIWFDSVAAVAREYGLPTITPEDPNSAAVLAQIAAAKPDFLFSFYYRKMLKAPLLAIPSRGAFNMHGSLLPKYRGRVPINWAVLHAETPYPWL